jgi:hypothetical protein
VVTSHSATSKGTFHTLHYSTLNHVESREGSGIATATRIGYGIWDDERGNRPILGSILVGYYLPELAIELNLVTKAITCLKLDRFR